MGTVAAWRRGASVGVYWVFGVFLRKKPYESMCWKYPPVLFWYGVYGVSCKPVVVAIP